MGVCVCVCVKFVIIEFGMQMGLLQTNRIALKE